MLFRSERWELVSSHTARRGFATNSYLKKIPVIDLMKLTGHQSQISFMRYIRITKRDTAIRMHEHIQKNWSTSVLANALQPTLANTVQVPQEGTLYIREEDKTEEKRHAS